MDDCSVLVEKVTCLAAQESLKEISRHYPNSKVTTEICGSRGVITVCQGRFIISKEFVETEESLSSQRYMSEYARILMGKARLVLIVPKAQAVKARMRLLEFNNFWLFYYQVFYYDEEGNIRRNMDRRAWCEMMGRPYDGPPRAPEIV